MISWIKHKNNKNNNRQFSKIELVYRIGLPNRTQSTLFILDFIYACVDAFDGKKIKMFIGYWKPILLCINEMGKKYICDWLLIDTHQILSIFVGLYFIMANLEWYTMFMCCTAQNDLYTFDWCVVFISFH